mgnify:CR=1 FL=1
MTWGSVKRLHVYCDPASKGHVNDLAGVESPERFPAALAGVERAEQSGVLVERRPCNPAEREALVAVHDQPVAGAESGVRPSYGRLGRLNSRTKVPRPDVRTRTPVESVELSTARTNVYKAVDYDWRGTEGAIAREGPPDCPRVGIARS